MLNHQCDMTLWSSRKVVKIFPIFSRLFFKILFEAFWWWTHEKSLKPVDNFHFITWKWVLWYIFFNKTSVFHDSYCLYIAFLLDYKHTLKRWKNNMKENDKTNAKDGKIIWKCVWDLRKRWKLWNLEFRILRNTHLEFSM